MRTIHDGAPFFLFSLDITIKREIHPFDSESESEVVEEEKKGKTLSWPVGQDQKYHMFGTPNLVLTNQDNVALD